MRRVSILLSATLLIAPGIAMAKASTATARDQLKELRGEAREVRSSALFIERLTTQSGTTWAQVDKQWNLIKPAQEAMVDQLNRLEAMDKSLTPAERQAVNNAKPNIEEISARTRELRAMLDRNGANVASPEFKTLAGHMARDASAVAHGADLRAAQTSSH